MSQSDKQTPEQLAEQFYHNELKVGMSPQEMFLAGYKASEANKSEAGELQFDEKAAYTIAETKQTLVDFGLTSAAVDCMRLQFEKDKDLLMLREAQCQVLIDSNNSLRSKIEKDKSKLAEAEKEKEALKLAIDQASFGESARMIAKLKYENQSLEAKLQISERQTQHMLETANLRLELLESLRAENERLKEYAKLQIELKLKAAEERDLLKGRVKGLEEGLSYLPKVPTQPYEKELARKLQVAKVALESIAKNSCCQPCREAGLVAREALKEIE